MAHFLQLYYNEQLSPNLSPLIGLKLIAYPLNMPHSVHSICQPFYSYLFANTGPCCDLGCYDKHQLAHLAALLEDTEVQLFKGCK